MGNVGRGCLGNRVLGVTHVGILGNYSGRFGLCANFQLVVEISG